MSVSWNPWHGCRRVSEGCRNCYVYRIDGKHGRESSAVTLNADFLLPLRESKGVFKMESGETVYTCFSSDFLIADADEWRPDAWRMMKLRPDLHFVFFTKRIERLQAVLPPDWGDGYENVTVGCTQVFNMFLLQSKQLNLLFQSFTSIKVRTTYNYLDIFQRKLQFTKQ